ncbi:MAG TPA: glycosyl hydrolase 53 family protein, partial [Longimicrobiales bacterium]|nr:glycosyl hydrolase 53 family protein [Longimicrobiales bacterium]
MIRSHALATLVLAALAAPLQAQQPPTEFGDVNRVEAGTPTNVVMAAYKTTMLADGEDEVLIRTFVTDSAGRQIMSADRIMRIYVNGDATVDRPATTLYAVTPRTDDEGADYWETRLVDGSSAFILKSGDTVDRIQVEVRSGDLPPAGHEIHTIPADVELLEPTTDQLENLRAQAIRDLPPMIGADISFLPQREANGAIYTDAGEERDAVRILADNGLNFVRLRIFVNPENPEGYSPEQGFAGLEYTKQMARRIDAAGMGFLLDFHYSDYWADPQQQNKPLAWRDLDFEGLKAAMRRYTTQVVLELTDQGTPPDMVQVGNEINHGLLWPEGHIQNLDNLAELLQAGIQGVEDANPDLPVMLHIALGGQNEESRFWLDNMIARGVQFDLIGLSFYPRWHATLDDLKANLHDLA